ncbi:hypothetical protein [Alteromonas gilva]|uniref:Small highly charged protein n=1 Tax=Alteromonas gilva TaxID=2987522 RepID=A0ABT5L2L0_9ALTE|nr:hypothetical protein [Alteromonas gilva]MDC8830711.1 hypothetical protein [Alteromonas gilva]
MSKDYRYQREEWDSVDDEDNVDDPRKSLKRQQTVKNKKKAMQQRDKQRRAQFDNFE